MNWRAYLVPGLVFQSVIVGGGYATGRELVEFFMPSGPMGGVFGLLTAGLVFAVVMSCAYEFARITRAYDYRSFCRELLGSAWPLFELVYLSGAVLILAVLGAAAGELVAERLQWPAWSGTLVMTGLVGLLTYCGSTLIATLLSLWSVLLYLAYALLFVLVFHEFRHVIDHHLSVAPMDSDWPLAGLRYAGYNLAIPSVLFCVPLLRTSRQTLGAGVFTGIFAIAPALAFFVAMLSHYPEIRDAPVPVLVLMASLDSPALESLLYLVVFGTFIETGTGLLHAINERVDVQVREQGRTLARWARPAIASALLVASVYGATQIGIVDLIDRGYGLLSWAYIAILILPLLSIGLLRIIRHRAS